MTHSPAKVMLTYLVARGHGVAGLNPDPAGWSVYRNKLPKEGDSAVALFRTSPMLDGREHEVGGRVVEHPGLQLMIRAKTEDLAEAKGMALETDLALIRNTLVTVGANTYRMNCFTKTTGLTYVGPEEQSLRALYSINGTVSIKEL